MKLLNVEVHAQLRGRKKRQHKNAGRGVRSAKDKNRALMHQ